MDKNEETQQYSLEDMRNAHRNGFAAGAQYIVDNGPHETFFHSLEYITKTWKEYLQRREQNETKT